MQGMLSYWGCRLVRAEETLNEAIDWTRSGRAAGNPWDSRSTNRRY
jgi:hypothetical protein